MWLVTTVVDSVDLKCFSWVIDISGVELMTDGVNAYFC